MFGFSKHCKICGKDIKKEFAEKRFGKYFCGPEHAQQYIKKREEQQRIAEAERKYGRRRGGCC